jgi:hypothetical protein
MYLLSSVRLMLLSTSNLRTVTALPRPQPKPVSTWRHRYMRVVMARETRKSTEVVICRAGQAEVRLKWDEDTPVLRGTSGHVDTSKTSTVISNDICSPVKTSSFRCVIWSKLLLKFIVYIFKTIEHFPFSKMKTISIRKSNGTLHHHALQSQSPNYFQNI